MPNRDSEDTHQLRMAVLRGVPKVRAQSHGDTRSTVIESSCYWRLDLVEISVSILRKALAAFFQFPSALALTDGTFEKSRKWNARAISVV